MKYLKPYKLYENNYYRPTAKHPVPYKCLDIMTALEEIEHKYGFHLTEIPSKGSKYGTMNFFSWAGDNLLPIFPKYTMSDDIWKSRQKQFAGTGIPHNRYNYFERKAVYEIPRHYDSSEDERKWIEKRNNFRANMTKMAEMSGRKYNYDDEKHIDFGPKSNDWVNKALDAFYELYSEYYKNDKLLIWNDEYEYDKGKQIFDYPLDKALFISEIEKWIESFDMDINGFYEWVLECQYIEGRYWNNTWIYAMQDENFRKKTAPNNIKDINELLRQIYKTKEIEIYLDYHKEVDEKIFD